MIYHTKMKKEPSVEDVIIDQFMFNFAINYDSIIKNIHVENGKRKKQRKTPKNTHMLLLLPYLTS